MMGFIEFTSKLAFALLLMMFWVMVIGGIAIGIGVLLHVFGVFTCGTVYCF